MTTGEHLVSLSGLGSATAAAHLLSIVSGGSSTTIFASQTAVRIDSDDVCVVTMRGRRAASPAEPKQKAFQKAAPVRRDTAVTSMAMETSVVTSTEEIFIIQTTSSAIASADLSREGVKT
jgi:hypothetical protein